MSAGSNETSQQSHYIRSRYSPNTIKFEHSGEDPHVIMKICVTLLIAGAAEVMRCLVCIRTGEWLSRGSDVEELEQVLIQQHAEKDPS